MMVREYLKSVLHEIEEQRKANTAEIEEQRLEKETIDKKIARIQSKKELDMEYFSPRRNEGSLREQLADLQKNNMILKEELRKLEEEEQQLAKDFTVYSIDLPGCGRSDKPNMIYTNYFYVQLLNDFTEKVIKRKTSVAATGLSGSFVIMAANNNENLFDKIFLINPKSINALNQIPNPKSRIAKLLINCPVLGTTLYYILMNRTNVEYNFTETYFHNPFQLSRRTVDIYHECAHRKGNGGKYLLSSIKGNFVNIDISHALKNLDNSIYIIGGASIPGINSIIHGYETLNPAIESALVEKAAYLPQLECPEAFYQTMKVFF